MNIVKSFRESIVEGGSEVREQLRAVIAAGTPPDDFRDSRRFVRPLSFEPSLRTIMGRDLGNKTKGK